MDPQIKPQHRRNHKRVMAMYTNYQKGNSLSQVAEAFGVSRQAVYDVFRVRGLELRSRPEPLPFVEFNGARYAPGKGGYYRKTNGNRNLLHRDVWEFYYGPIPEGWDIHHKDEDRANCDIDNLECLPKSEHTRLYSPHNNQYTKGRKLVKDRESA